MTYICLFSSGIIGSLDTTYMTWLACSAGIFIRCTNGFNSESAMLKLPKRGGNGAGQGEGGGGGEKEEKTPAQKYCENEKHPLISIFFLPFPSLLSFFRPHTYPKGYYFYSPQSTSVITTKMAAWSQRYIHEQAFAYPKYTCTAGYDMIWRKTLILLSWTSTNSHLSTMAISLQRPLFWQTVHTLTLV